MSEDVIIRADRLGKKYLIGHHAERERYVALRDVLVRGARGFWRKAADMVQGRAIVAGGTIEEFWALKDVSFEVKRGEVLGIIGRNGAGKSTLLKILSRITEPSEGRVTISGRVASLLEVGTGFHPELTGRENIYLNGAILGMTRAEIGRKFDEIVAFAEVKRFLDTPVKRYSSGMYVRLAFAVAAHLEPEILLIDEVLAVGDIEFQKKCLGKMEEVAKGGRTVLFVSHNIQAIITLCTRALLVAKGSLVSSGPPVEVARYYLQNTEADASIRHRVWKDMYTAPGNESIRLHEIRLRTDDPDSIQEISFETPIDIEISYWNLIPGAALQINIQLDSLEGVEVFEDWSAEEKNWGGRSLPQGLFRSVCRIPANLLNERTYRVRVTFFDAQWVTITFDIPDALIFTVHDVAKRPVEWYGRFKGAVHPRLHWKTDFVGGISRN
jgi:lipopolysaccharide transport system ATP-binding protein